ncbi:hypothetical protein [Hymenobacter sp. BT190]|uniref:hypothetical protein n=1 Tax=Hymenobacter sp. BT190 TaxID=2763505 RepID=UPI0016516821|nr:hypothetical protein [Hymenobacter sp. BT190]MBC6696797.1 hypothetical protein [Hymenobacter sp. BT190]
MTLFLRLFFFYLSVILWLSLPRQAQAQIYYLELDRQKITLPNRTIQVEQVVDGRPGKPTIGIVYRTLNNRPAAVLFRNGVEAEFSEFLREQLPARPADHPIVLCLRQLRVSEQLNGVTEAANADLAADVYAHLPDGYHFMRSVGARTSKRALETTSLHQQHVALLLQQCLEQLTEADWTQAYSSPVRTLKQLPTDLPAASLTVGAITRLPAILREAPRRGVYFTFAQFLSNQPEPNIQIRLDTLPSRRWRGGTGRVLWGGTTRFEAFVVANPNQRLGQQQALSTEVWGFSDGQQVFVQHEKMFYPLVRQANFFTFIGERPADIEYLRARSQAQARAGIIGTATVQAQDHSGEPTPYAVDMRTGQSAPFPDPLRALPARTDTAYIYLYRQADTAVTPVSVFIEGREVGQLQPNSYLELPWPYYARLMRLCLGLPAAAPCQLLVPDAARPNYLRITPAPTDGIFWQWVDAKQGEADLDALDKLGVPVEK